MSAASLHYQEQIGQPQGGALMPGHERVQARDIARAAPADSRDFTACPHLHCYPLLATVRGVGGANREHAISISPLLFAAVRQFVRSPWRIARTLLSYPVASCRWTRVLCACDSLPRAHATPST